jgi:hypothetical protein
VNAFTLHVPGGTQIGGAVLSGTTGSVLFVGSGPILSQDNANFFWDDTNNRLGLGTASPGSVLDAVGSSTSIPVIRAKSPGVTPSAAVVSVLNSSGTEKIAIGWDTGFPNGSLNLKVTGKGYFGDSPGNIRLNSTLVCTENFTDPASDVYGIFVSTVTALTADSPSRLGNTLQLQNQYNSNKTLGQLTACVFNNYIQGVSPGLVSNVFGVDASIALNNTATATNVTGSRTTIANFGTGTNISNVRGFEVVVYNGLAAGTGGIITNLAGIVLSLATNIAGATITNTYGIYLASLIATGGTQTNVYGIYQSEDTPLNYFNGKTGFGIVPSGNGKLQVKSGSSTTPAKAGGTIAAYHTSTANSSTTETTLWSASIAASTLATDGDTLHFEYVGQILSSANSKTLRVKWGATTFYNSSAQNPALSTGFVIRGSIVRTGATVQKCSATLHTGVMTLFLFAAYGTAGETLSGAVNLVLTGQGGASNEVYIEYGKVWWSSAA